ncbi:hypothetical protein FNJ87_10490 [Nonlabens mediterrranea]|uniref:ATPase n=1 Tax=Nonlabens mediterrranea TaxID=1419947 RepID=A0ABS0A7F9_9FLAO|nr:conserved hypothetical protein [Flavobacteria bacterium BBFL7]MBF4984743.1 hypothetical protein [Nonlabens mediterrranea]
MIHRLQFSIDINASKSQIWDVLWDDHSYRDWVSVFFEGSYVVTDQWKEKSQVLFLGPDQNGIYSMIEKHIPNKIMRFKHIGNVINGIEQDIDEETKKWSGARETYTLMDHATHHTLVVEIDVLDEHLEFMKSTFPIALERIKQKCTIA